MQSLGSGLMVAILLLANAASLVAQSLHNTITFDNQSGEPALVKLVGPTAQTVEVPNVEQRAVTVAAGTYYLLARYGADPRRYTYSRGEPFKVEETATQSAAITITLHKVIGGNYPARPASAEEFNRVTPKQDFLIFGTVGDSAGAPVANKTVYLFPVQDGRVTMVLKLEGGRSSGILASSAKTNEQGKFTIKVPEEIVREGGELTIGVPERTAKALSRDGKPLTFRLADGSAWKLDLGKMTLYCPNCSPFGEINLRSKMVRSEHGRQRRNNVAQRTGHSRT